MPRGRHDNVGTIFGGTAATPLKISEGKTVQKLVRFCATSHFDHEYLQNGEDIDTGKRRYQQRSLTRVAKKLVNFGPQTKKL